jgi:D-alanine-D-alanine ligase
MMTEESSGNSCARAVDGDLRVAVLMGGVGEERDISLQSGNCVAQALRQAGLNVVEIDIHPESMSTLEKERIDVCFVALHGTFGEDGQLQQMLEDRSLVYTGSGPEASRLAFDKWASKRCFIQAGVATPNAIRFDSDQELVQLEKRVSEIGDRLVVKPLRQGSTIGVSILDDAASALDAARTCSGQFGDCMIEQYISGTEITVGVLQDRALPIIEIRSKTGFYDYEAKYLDDRTEFLLDTINDPALVAEIEAAALSCFHALGCRDFARVDFILSERQEIYALEVNTIPGFTSHSLLPRAAARTGLQMPQLCLQIVRAALDRRNHTACEPVEAMKGSR